ncbi:hypothetical protein QBC38DRAFT_365393 [Podospora fimiseda]|uniref:Transmembrane and coiled-coil domain-containing protein n=1 Tax=Podospora fimiseda TaxID=252190 RepID=A0AAN7GXY9_9PEZI|nr:hypothetical protein QBC38DRAFT_365393 [Podospora fimiseda]
MPGVDGPSAGTDQNGPSKSIPTKATTPTPTNDATMTVEYDDFGLPIRKPKPPVMEAEREEPATGLDGAGESNEVDDAKKPKDPKHQAESGSEADFKDAVSKRGSAEASEVAPTTITTETSKETTDVKASNTTKQPDEKPGDIGDQAVSEAIKAQNTPGHQRNESIISNNPAESSGFSHQQLSSKQAEKKEDDDDDWQTMPAYAPYDIYDDNNKLVAREFKEDDDQTYGYAGLGGAGKGYTKVLIDDDAESATSMDENTQYLFQDRGQGSTALADDDDAQRDAVGQLQATKDLLTEGQRIAYVGLTRLELSAMLKEMEFTKPPSSAAKKALSLAQESMKMWSQKMMIRLYSHMDISPDEQVMIEQLAAHGVMPQDLTPVLMANARVKNPMAEEGENKRSSTSSSRPSRTASIVTSEKDSEQRSEAPPPYEANENSDFSAPVQTPSNMSTSQKIDIDIRWTVLCDLFLVLIADSIYDGRSRVLLERVAKDLEISWLDICRFEKKVTDALEMQQNAEENWNEEDHMENRRKLALKRRYVMMGLATVGGGLVIGLSAGLLAPVIGAGLAAGFTAIGVGGTSGFLGGVGGAAVITGTAATSGSIIGGRAANRRTGAVRTFEYRPLHNNKRVNLIVTISGWMTGKVDDVRLPFSTVDPIMGDIYSVLWEPEMLKSMGDTINILATEALTQGLQQVLAQTFLTALMAGLQVPVILTKLSYLIDNPWAVSLDRATMAGLILADSLIDRNLGTRPVTLVGYSLGSRVIFSCLKELAKKGAFGLIQNVYLFGSPVVFKQEEYLRARSVVSGRFVNGFNRNDWILGYLFRLTNGGIRRVAGLAPIDDVPGVENMDVSEFVIGHMDYRTAMPRLLRECGWLVESDEFTEIEDPDPDNHQERQRELISEIEEARRELEKEGLNETKKKSGFALFRRKKALQKQEWEVYEDSKSAAARGSGKTEDKDGNNHGVLFDVDAIRAELAKEARENNKNGGGLVDEDALQVKEIKSTLPPMKLEIKPSDSPTQPSRARTPSYSFRESPILSASGHSPSHDRKVSHGIPERTPTYPSSKPESNSYYYQAPGTGIDDEIQMIFDTGFDDKPSSTTIGGYSSSKTGWDSPASLPPAPSSSSVAETAARPGVRTSQTVPNISLADPWADDGLDDDFGKEKEISMTFA